jgi:type I restriction-modification system DNA methylase subunit
MIDKLTAQKKISDLVTRFEEQIDSYRNSNYNETQTRRDFIDPFFKALGWDIDNEQGSAEAYREVIHEDKVKISGATKAPDYSFRLEGGKRLFFVEAKKPSISVKEDIQPAYQIRRYGWSAKLPISIITDFEEFAIYDCTKKPDLYDKTSVARIKYFTFRDYLKEFDFIWETFSKEQVRKGSFDKFIQSDKHKKGTTSVDKEFLESLDRWRTYLAVNISWNNKNLNEDEINFAVQQTIDRLIFLRIAEDRSVEPYGNLKHAIKQGNLYSNLFEQFRKADEKYNSGLFDQKKDRISENLIIENKVIKTIINELYYPECPYEFSVLPVEILGSAYEQFLGKIIRITPGHHAKIEEKPEVRKAGGVYYTPQYIVEYIVKNTIGKLIDGKTPKEISKIKIVDPACGSGSFLIGAYQYLMDWHKNYYYTNNSKISKGNKNNPLTPEGHLTTAEKKRILLDNIYGVDLDLNAVEVTKLSLLLKCMEGETNASIQQQFKLWNEQVLPTLENNIKSGNSLIDTDFYDNQIDFGDEKKIKPFNWPKAFPGVFKQGGFDAVISNPPYIRVQLLNESKETLNYFSLNFKTAISGNYDIYVLFIEKALQILNPNGVVGFILPHKFFNSKYGIETRRLLSNGCNLNEIVHFGDKQVFNGATTYTCLLFLKNKPSTKFLFSEVNDLETWQNDKVAKTGYIEAKSLAETEWNLATGLEQVPTQFFFLRIHKKVQCVEQKCFRKN